MPIPMLPGTQPAPCAVYWTSFRQETRLLVGALVADASNTTKEYVWNDATLPCGDEWAVKETAIAASVELVRSISDSLIEEPILLLIDEGTLCETAWRRLRPLIPCAIAGAQFSWIHGRPPEGSPALELAEVLAGDSALTFFQRVRGWLSEEARFGSCI